MCAVAIIRGVPGLLVFAVRRAVAHHGRARAPNQGAATQGERPTMTARSKNHDWLAQTVETALEPDLPICDPHHHLWDQNVARTAPRYLIDEIVADLSAGHNIVSTVFIECGAMFKKDGPEELRPIGDTEFVNGIAARSASGLYGKTRIAAGIIGTANLRLGGGVGAVLDAQVAAGGGRFRGVRLGEGKKAISELATCPNVVAKLGGINMEINGFGWHERSRPPGSHELADATRHYYDFTIEKFGVDRCMFESNFPVDVASCSYTVL